MITGDGKAYVFLAKHGALIQELPNRSVMLTLEGRTWIITFLLFHEYLSKELLNHIAEFFQRTPSQVAFETGRMLREVSEKWKADNKDALVNGPKELVYPTDLNYSQVTLLLDLMIAGQESLERAAEGRKVH